MTGLYSVLRIRTGAAAAAMLLLAGCHATPTPVETPAPAAQTPLKTLPAPAPTAQEMEGGLANTNGHSAEATLRRVEVQVSASERPPAARPQQMPLIRAGNSPIIDEVTEISTRDLHGYNFPGMESLREPAMAHVTAEPLPAPETKQPEPEPAAEPEAKPEPVQMAAAEPAEATEAEAAEPAEAEPAPQPEPVEPEPVIEPAPAPVEAEAKAAEPAPADAPEPQEPKMEAAATAPESDIDGMVEQPEPTPVQPEPVVETAAASPVADAQPMLSEFTRVDPAFYGPDPGGYSIGAGDTLEFESFNDPLLSRELAVRYDGHISLPLIPDLDVDGLTREDAERQVRDAYRKIFRDPQISLLVKETASKTYALIGDVEQPGVYPFLRPTSLIEALSLAGGLRRRNSSSSVGGFVGVTGQLTKAFVIRHRNGERVVLQYDLRQLGRPGEHASDAPIYHGDLIYVPEGVNLVYLLGESRNSVIVELTEGMTLLQMLSLSGGFDASTGKLRNVVLMRQMDGERTQVFNINLRNILKTGEDIRLQPGDIIYIPRKFIVQLAEFVSRFTGSISPVLDMYNQAVDAYYARDLAQAQLRAGEVSRTLTRLGQIEQFGQSTRNIVDLYGAP
ncbi:MAG: hypothetical protein GC168_06450 [Candidatus Hydrogenedens sp.]|nr:hypothetical protein [Candidatus Hydrogenedens sp.]